MFLIRTAFWLSLVILLIPTGTADHEDTATAGSDLSAQEAVMAARHTVADLAGFCDRNPETCETGSAAIKAFGQKAQNGAKLLYEYLSEADFGNAAPQAESAGPNDAVPGTDTLRSSDRDIPWQGDAS